MSSRVAKITMLVAVIICAVSLYAYKRSVFMNTNSEPLYRYNTPYELEAELKDNDGSYAIYGASNERFNCNYIISCKKHGDLIRLIRMNSVINIEKYVSEIIDGSSREQQTINYLQLPEDARAEDFSWLNNLEIEYKANISEIETLVEDFDNREIAVSDWLSGYYYHRGLFIVTCNYDGFMSAKCKLILPMEASPDSNIKHAGPPAIEVGIDEKE